MAQLRIYAELLQLIGMAPRTTPRMFMTDTLGSPFAEVETLGSWYGKISESRRQANEVKRKEPITVVIGNPQYKEKAKGRGGWIEEDNKLNVWIPPAGWGVGAHTKHLRNLYVYFWRWATWKVFDHDPQHDTGVICFITVAGFLNGPGFQGRRDYLRRKADHIWVIDCTPEGHQPDVPTRIFQGVQPPVCIVMAARTKEKTDGAPAKVKYAVLPEGEREDKFKALEKLKLGSRVWQNCSTDWRSPFLPAASGKRASYPAIGELFAYNGSGVQPARMWIIAPDQDSLFRRWHKLICARSDEKEDLFHPQMEHGRIGSHHMNRIHTRGLPGYEAKNLSVAAEHGEPVPPVRYGFRSFDRQWIIPDNRLINRPNPTLWQADSQKQIHLTALHRSSPMCGPAFTFTTAIPDYDHYKGSFGGRVFPLYRDAEAQTPNLPPKLLELLSSALNKPVTAEDFIAYIAGVAAHPGYTTRFQKDLFQPGLRIPLTAEAKLFFKASELGRRVIWLHTFGERFADSKADRPA